MDLGFNSSGAFLTLKMNSQKIYFMIIKRFIKNFLFDIKYNFCEATVRLCTGTKSRTRTYAAPYIIDMFTFYESSACFRLTN